MSHHYNYLTVILEQDLKDEDAEPIIGAIKQMRGVLNVMPNVSDPTAIMAQERAKWHFSQKLWQVLHEESK